MTEILDDILDECNNRLPQFNKYLLNDFRKDQINGCISFMEMTFEEATRLFQGRVKFKGTRVLTPEERIQLTLSNPRFTPVVEIAPTELQLVEFLFTYDDNQFSIPLYMPYLKDNCMMINGSQYYLQFALTDRVFYHISKDNGLGIKVLRAHLRFWRNLKYPFASVTGTRYADQVLVVKAHLRSHKYTSEDIRTSLLLYPLSMVGWTNTLTRYGIRHDQITFTGYANKEDTTHEYFQIRKATDEDEGLYVKIDKQILSANPDESTRLQMRVITALLYVLQYFVKNATTMYQDNVQLRKYLTNDNDTTVWQVILGSTIYGINYSSETQICSYAEQHLDSLTTYLDPHTKLKLRDIGVFVKDIHELIDYIFINMDSHVVNYTPADLSEKRINIIDLLCGTIVRRIFTKVYSFTNNNRKNRVSTTREVESLFRIGIKSFTQLHQAGSVVAINPAKYNDNYLLIVGGRKVRTTHSATGGKSGDLAGAKTKQQVNHLSSPSHRFHPSWMYVESCLIVSHTNPDVAGNINYFLDIDTKGNVQIADYAKEYQDQMLPYCITK